MRLLNRRELGYFGRPGRFGAVHVIEEGEPLCRIWVHSPLKMLHDVSGVSWARLECGRCKTKVLSEAIEMLACSLGLTLAEAASSIEHGIAIHQESLEAQAAATALQRSAGGG